MDCNHIRICLYGKFYICNNISRAKLKYYRLSSSDFFQPQDLFAQIPNAVYVGVLWRAMDILPEFYMAQFHNLFSQFFLWQQSAHSWLCALPNLYFNSISAPKIILINPEARSGILRNQDFC